MFNRIKNRLTLAVEHRVDRRFDERIDELVRERDAQISAVRAELARVTDRFAADYGHMRTEFDRVAPQIAALEYRFESLRSQLVMPEPDSADAQARAELEHERARLRLELVSHYEERLRRLEEPRS